MDNGEWIEGGYAPIGGQYHYIFTGKLDITGLYPTFDRREVDPSTVGQYTGLTDKNGMKIFEGDIVDVARGKKEIWRLRIDDIRFIPETMRGSSVEYIEIIGNIHDNPNLMGGEDDG